MSVVFSRPLVQSGRRLVGQVLLQGQRQTQREHQQRVLLTAIILQKREFGRNIPVPRFGHNFRPPQFRAGVLGSGILMLFTSLYLDWGYLYYEHGIWIPFITPFFMSAGVHVPESGVTTSVPDKEDCEIKFKSEIPADMMRKREEMMEFMVEKEEAKRAENPDRDRDFVKMMRAKLNVKAEEMQSNSESRSVPMIEMDLAEERKKVGFRNRKIMEYENRIRQYSTPDKIFRYFATYRVSDEKGHSEVMMSPLDFLRSITPGIQQPERLGLDSFTDISFEGLQNISARLGVQDTSIFYQLGSGGLISFSDYIFLLTVLSTSRRHFEIAFKMFDLNGDGNVDAKEFEVVTNLMKNQSSMGHRHRDHQTTGSTFKGINSGLITYFFGENQEGILTVDKFLEFQRCLQNEILALEFKKKSLTSQSHPDDVVSEKDFADLLIAYAGFSSKKKAKMLKRVRKEFHRHRDNDDDESIGSSQGITLTDYLNFFQVLYSINDVDTALTFYHIAGAPIERETMRHVAKTVAGVDLSDHIIDVVFVLFDENGDGKLSNKEFVSVMKQRAMRGLEKPKDTGIGKMFSAITKCVSDTRPTILGGTRKT